MQNHMTKNDKKYIQQPSDFAGKIFINFIEYTAYKLHVNCTETTDVIWAYMHAVVRGMEACFQRVP